MSKILFAGAVLAAAMSMSAFATEAAKPTTDTNISAPTAQVETQLEGKKEISKETTTKDSKKEAKKEDKKGM